MNKDTSMSLATLAMAGLVLFLLLLWVRSAEPATEICLSKAEARALWPRSHLYWYSSRHCWSNRRGPPRHLRIDPVFGAKAEAEKKKPEVKEVREDQYNELDAAADSDTYFRAEPFSLFGSLVVQENFEMEWKIRIEGHLHK